MATVNGAYKNKLLLKILALFICLLEISTKVRAPSCSYAQRYYTSCGSFGWSRCTRYRVAYQCCTGWSGSGCSIANCNQIPNYCKNGGVCQSSGRCNCPEGTYEQDCRYCTQISNCDREVCTTSSDQICNKCNGDYGALGQAYRPSDNRKQCIKQCSWRSDSNACFPGSCSDLVCHCLSGFSGADCRNMLVDQAPDILHHEIFIKYGPTRVVSQIDTTTTYTNAITNFTSITLDWVSSYIQPTLPSLAPYVHSVTLGVVKAVGSCTMKGNHWSTLCFDSKDSPGRTILDCGDTFSASHASNFTTGDKLTCELTSESGGTLKLFDRDNGDRILTRYYNGRTSIIEHNFVFDYEAPYHCSGNESCNTDMLDVGPDCTDKTNIHVWWKNWVDSVSDTGNCHLEVRELSTKYGSELVEDFSESPIFSVDGVTPGKEVLLTLPGVYSFLLSISDKAGNYRLARRFALFDNVTNGPTVIESSAITAHPSASNTFVKVVLDWEGHFQNSLHMQGFLWGIGEYKGGDLDTNYDQNFGKRGRSAIPNVLGVTNFKVHYDVDHHGGDTILDPKPGAVWSDEHLLTNQSYDIHAVDGDSIRFWVKATDIMDKSTTESVLVNVDFSPPVIEQFWLTVDGEKIVPIHNSDQLQDMRVHVQTMDVHSGLRTILWRLYDATNMANETKLVDKGNVPVRRINSVTELCSPGECICTPSKDCFAVNYEIKPSFLVSQHNYDYIIEIEVTNEKHLTTRESIEITIDVSPPSVGSVHDGVRGDKDVDFQAELKLNAHWDGFFDPESGIRYYEYTFARNCLNNDDMANAKEVYETTNRDITWVAPEEGTYVLSIVAYNHALTPSKVVCSDGATIDASPPEVSTVNFKGLRARPGLIHDNQDVVWSIEENLQRTIIQNATDNCRNISVGFEDLWMFPLKDGAAEANFTCDYRNPFRNDLFISIDNHYELSWIGDDQESMIYNYEVGLSSHPSALVPDISAFQSFGTQREATIRNPNVGHGSTFYLVLKATNKAHLLTKKVLGPITVDTTPPTFIGLIVVQSNEQTLDISWAADAFSDDIDPNLTFEIGIGEAVDTVNTLPFKAIEEYNNDKRCSAVEPTTCEFHVSILLDTFSWKLHPNHDYYVLVKATNTAGLSTIGASPAYTHSEGLPAAGVVFDVVPSDDDHTPVIEDIDDIDVQTSNRTIAAKWSGFEHHYLSVSYLFAVGSNPGSSEITNGFLNVEMESKYEATGLLLQIGQIYYTTVVALTDTGNVSVSSDGVTVALTSIPQDGVFVNDGPKCTGDVSDIKVRFYVPFSNDDTCSDDVDIDFQVSSSIAEAHWVMPNPYPSPDINNVLWSLEERLDLCEGTYEWQTIIDNQAMGLSDHHTHTDIKILDGGHYRSKVKFCYLTLCYNPVISDGFMILSQSPSPGTVVVESIVTDSDKTFLDVVFQPFRHDYLNEINLMEFYEWTLTEEPHSSVLLQWKRMDNLEWRDSKIYTTVSYASEVTQSMDCVSIVVRGYNRAGLSATTSTTLWKCDKTSEKTNLVVDANHEIIHEKNAEWTEPDIDFKHDKTTMFAVWATLRHGYYKWAVIEITDEGKEHNLQDPCDYPMAIQCGQTENEYVNTFDLMLQHGHRYAFCIHADAVTKEYETWSEELPEISACSDGVMIDVTPPIAGDVWFSSSKFQKYQHSTTELVLDWDPFTDVEEHDIAVNYYGVESYHYAIGTLPGKSDVKEFSDAGIAHQVIITDVLLQNGHQYYGMVKGTDFVGLSSIAISEPVIIDNTPPVAVENAIIDIGGTYIQSPHSILISWDGVFYDEQSGIDFYEWGLGSLPEHADIAPMQVTESEAEETDSNLLFKEGHSYYVIIKAVNGAGLTLSRSFGPFLVEYSPPVGGHVFDGLLSHNERDFDFQTDDTFLAASWGGFYDPHTNITEYKWSIGLCKVCSDVLEERSVGLNEDAFASHLNIVPGFIYYVTVTACNDAGLCSNVPSDGILVDSSSPVVGSVYDGPSEADVDFIDARHQIAAHWWGFHDPQSDISHYDWQAGTLPGAQDILSPRRLHSQSMAFLSLENPLPLGTNIFVTVRAFNQAGLWIEASSDGFQVDETGPELLKNVTQDAKFGIFPGSQVVRDSVRVEWRFRDLESGVRKQYATILTHQNGDVVDDLIQIGPDDTQYIFTNLDLKDGNEYAIQIIACNGAGICASATSEYFLNDASQPTVGSFATDIEYTGHLDRNIEGWMMWRQNNTNNESYIDLAWVGFDDLHSGIDYYFVTVGTNFDEADLTPNMLFMVDHENTGNRTNEGIVQTAVVTLTGSVSELGRIYVSVWAINGVGSRSERAYSAFDVGLSADPDEGALILVRQCDAHSCEGHCTCAPRNQPCPPVLSYCYDISDDNPNMEINVIDIMDMKLLSVNTSMTEIEDTDFITSSATIAAMWIISSTHGEPIKRYEWSVGYSSNLDNEPEGVFDPALEEVWHDVGQDENAIVFLEKGRELTPGLSYDFFVRAWYGEDTYAVFRSDGFIPLIMCPQPSSQRGAKVKDLPNESATKDIDFSTNRESISVSWRNVFVRDASSLSHFEVALGTFPGGQDIQQFSDNIIPHTITSHKFENLQLQVHTKYYVSVKAYNKARLTTVEGSDGFIIDTTAPSVGVVFDGLGLHDAEFQNTTSFVASSWHGFVDLESYIHHYEWCVGDSPDPLEFNIVPCIDVGVHLLFSRTVPDILIHGHIFYSKVFAVNGAGISSDVVVSDGFTVDTTPPIAARKVSITGVIHADWDFVDLESPILDYSVAVGTVPGGTQLQTFKSVGVQSSVFVPDVTVSHGTTIYSTVVAKNAAELTSIEYSGPFTFDATPPEMTITDGDKLDEDLVFVTSYNVCVSLTATDIESGISSCECATGLEPLLGNILPKKEISPSTSVLCNDIEGLISDGVKVYVTVWCQNNAGLSSHSFTNGVQIITKPPVASEASVSIHVESMTSYPARGVYQSQANFLRASWTGFHDPSGIQYYECKLDRTDTENVVDWNRCGNAFEAATEISDLFLESNETYRLSVRAVNFAYLSSEVVDSHIFIDASQPEVTGTPIETHFDVNGTLTLTWCNSYSSISPLTYEISIGTQLGGCDVLQWIETLQCTLTASPLELDQDYYVTLTAINAAGLFHTENIVIAG